MLEKAVLFRFLLCQSFQGARVLLNESREHSKISFTDRCRYSLASIYLCFLLFLDHLIDLYLKKQIGSPWSDRTEGLTQCPITPRDTFVYQFVVDRFFQSLLIQGRGRFNCSSLTYPSLEPGHNMIVVEADGYYVEPFVVKNLNIYSGETYSVLVKADQDPLRNYWATSNVISQKLALPLV
ncbi:hypothetical protein GIB67_003453 [Kingdonia uniflora]|uniref:Plastocyanin-like domain-containing protein n=1 Tax=Kingdonia uniflora TaxID=39325 RepID=A0A7J7P930_9MAGN|nr:hypothetical protein GIB67_003453 [Kingdonia uniflora]